MPVMQGNPELKSMKELYGSQLAQRRKLTERKNQAILLPRYSLLFVYHQNAGQIFLYHLFETSVSTRNANVHIDKMIISSSFQRISFQNISLSQNLSHHNFRCPPFNSKTRLNGSVRFSNIILERRILQLSLVEQTIVLGPVIYVGNRTFRRGDQSSAADHVVGAIEKLTVK